MKKIHLFIMLILITNNIFCRSFGGTTSDIYNEQELNFQSVEKSMKVIKVSEIKNYKVIDTINKLENLLNEKTKIISIDIKNPEAYLIQNFESKLGTISIAIKSDEEFKIYEIISPKIIYDNYINDTLNLKKISKLDEMMSAPNFKIKELKRIKLDKSKSEELVIKFSYQSIGCPNCNISQANTTNGYLIFDFDKLQVLKLINFNSTSLTQQIKYNENYENFKIEFRKNYVKMKNRKYFYKDDKLISK
jgi:hypothetical protein